MTEILSPWIFMVFSVSYTISIVLKVCKLKHLLKCSYAKNIPWCWKTVNSYAGVSSVYHTQCCFRLYLGASASQCLVSLRSPAHYCGQYPGFFSLLVLFHFLHSSRFTMIKIMVFGVLACTEFPLCSMWLK